MRVITIAFNEKNMPVMGFVSDIKCAEYCYERKDYSYIYINLDEEE